MTHGNIYKMTEVAAEVAPETAGRLLQKFHFVCRLGGHVADRNPLADLMRYLA